MTAPFTIDHDERLRRFFSREEAGQTGLRSSFGVQLEAHATMGRHAARKGTSNGVSAEDVHPPRIIDYQNRFSRLESAMTGRALNLVSDTHCLILRAHYEPKPPGAFSGVLMLQPLAAVMVLAYGQAELHKLCHDARHGPVASREGVRKAIEKRRENSEKQLDLARLSFAECLDRVRRELGRHEAAKMRAEDVAWEQDLASEDD